MANDAINIKRTYVAASDLSGKLGYFVKLTGDRTVDVCSAVTDRIIGVLCNTPKSGEEASVVVFGVAKVVVGASNLTAGAQIGTDTAGKAVAYIPGTDTTKYVVGVVEAAATAAAYASVLIDTPSAGRGA